MDSENTEGLMTARAGPDKVGVTNMSICMFHHYYLPLFSGAAIRSHRQARIIAASGHKVWVLTPRYPGFRNEEVLDGIPVVRARTLGRTRMGRFLAFMLSATWELVRRRKDYDLVHFFGLGLFDVLPLVAVKALGKRVLYQMTMMPPNPRRLGGKSWALVRLGLGLVDGFLVLNTPLRRVLEAQGVRGRPVAVIPNGVDVDLFHPTPPSEKARLRRELGLEADARYICFVGTVEERKGVDVLVSAFAEVAAERPEARLLIVGRDEFVKPGFEGDKGYQRAQAFVDSVKQRVQMLGLAGRVIFTGHTDRVPDYLKASDAFAFPSRREGFPSVVIQAMATGLPCIVSELDGISRDMIHHGVDGYIVEGHDPGQYAERILQVLDNPAEAERVGQSARRTVEQRFRLEHVVERYVSFCQELLAT